MEQTVTRNPARVYRLGYEAGRTDRLHGNPECTSMASDDIDYMLGYYDGYDGKLYGWITQ